MPYIWFFELAFIEKERNIAQAQSSLVLIAQSDEKILHKLMEFPS